MLSAMLYNHNSLLSFKNAVVKALKWKNMKKFGDQLNDTPSETSWLVTAMAILYHVRT